MVDQALVCARCHEEFLWTAAHQAANPEPPDKCFPCRQTLYDLEKAAQPVVPPAVDINKSYRDRKAREARDRRERKAAQMAAIKKALRTPVAKILELAKEARRAVKMENAEYKKEMDMNRGLSMEGAPAGLGQFVTNVDIEGRAAMLVRAEALGSPTEDEDGNPCWPENDRRNVRPEGSTSDDEADNDSTFFVKLSDFDEARFFRELFIKYFVADGEHYVCRLCLANLAWESEGRRHMDSAHGLPGEPEHLRKYGNVIKKELALFKRDKM
jgi:hypothetical protein